MTGCASSTSTDGQGPQGSAPSQILGNMSVSLNSFPAECARCALVRRVQVLWDSEAAYSAHWTSPRHGPGAIIRVCRRRDRRKVTSLDTLAKTSPPPPPTASVCWQCHPSAGRENKENAPPGPAPPPPAPGGKRKGGGRRRRGMTPAPHSGPGATSSSLRARDSHYRLALKKSWRCTLAAARARGRHSGSGESGWQWPAPLPSMRVK